MISDPGYARLRRSLDEGDPIADRDFDALYPPAIRSLSAHFWTPVSVAQRAAKLLAPLPGMRVLDVGAGVGKLCIVVAASTRATVTGIEHRKHLVDAAEDAARKLALRTRFIHGDVVRVDWKSFDAFYFYNPFYENVGRSEARIDDAVELSYWRFVRDMERAVERIEDAPTGTRVVTYHGLGADLPACYRLASSECAGTDALKLWIKGATHWRP